LTASPALVSAGHFSISPVTIPSTPKDAVSMPAFGGAYSDAEIAALANYVTARFGAKASQLAARDVAVLRKQTSQ